jgi:predicted nucleic acid-binding protein
MAVGEPGPSTKWLQAHKKAKLWVSAVTVAEVLEGAADMEAVGQFLDRFHWQGIHHSHATRVALLQQRSSHRMGENDAWQAAVAIGMRGKLLGHDPKAFSRLGSVYLDHRAGTE